MRMIIKVATATRARCRRHGVLSDAESRGHRARKGAAGQRAPLRLRRSALRADSPAVLGLRSRRITRYVRCAHCAQTDAASQKWKRALAARADRSPPLLGAAESLRPLPGRASARRQSSEPAGAAQPCDHPSPVSGSFCPSTSTLLQATFGRNRRSVPGVVNALCLSASGR